MKIYMEVLIIIYFIGGLLCIPMLSSNIWNPATKPVDMLKAISFIFHNPNPNDPANPTFPKDPI